MHVDIITPREFAPRGIGNVSADDPGRPVVGMKCNISGVSVCIWIAVAAMVAFGACGQLQGKYSFGDRIEGGGHHYGSDPVLAPDRRYVVFGTVGGPSLGAIAVRDVNDETTSILFDSPRYEGQPTIDPLGKHIAFVSEKEGLPAIYVMNIDGQNVRKVTASEFADFHPVFSADGRQIAFTRHMSQDADFFTYEEVFVVNIDGTNERRLTNNGQRDHPIRFSKDGKFLYISTLDNTSQYSTSLAKMDLTSGEIQRVFSIDLSLSEICAVSSDEKTALYIAPADGDYDYEVFKCNMVGEQRQQLTKFNSYIGTASFGFHSELATLLAEPERDGSGMMYILKVSNGTTTPLGSNVIK